ncbi:MAG: TonB family protein [Pseudomonadota bacterium]
MLVLAMAAALLADYPPPPVIDGVPRLVERPSEQDMIEAYPPKALRAGVSGRVWLTCRLTAEGRLNDCAVGEEEPRDLGFGQAALSLVPYFRWGPPPGDVREERSVRFPIVWNLPD